MKIGVLSDTHGDLANIRKVIKRVTDVAMWLHAGDCAPDARYLAVKSQTKVIGIAGNRDWPGPSAKEMEAVQAGNLRIFFNPWTSVRCEFWSRAVGACG